jgi:hypothetical protein
LVPRVWENWQSTLAELPMPVQDYILRDVTLFPRGSVENTSPMCHSPLQHRLRQATHNTLGLVHGLLFNSETGLPYGQVFGYPPPADVPGSRSSPRWLGFTCINNDMDTDISVVPVTT